MCNVGQATRSPFGDDRDKPMEVEVIPSHTSKVFQAEYTRNTNDPAVTGSAQGRYHDNKLIVAASMYDAAGKAHHNTPEGYRLVELREIRTSVIL